MASKKCFVNSVRGKGKAKEVQWIDVPKLPDGSVPSDAMKEAIQEPNEVGISATEKAIEDLV